MVKGLRHRLFTAVTRVRIPYGLWYVAVETLVEKVVRTKTIDIEPMELDEAILQMELLGHDFFIYKDVEDNTTNVIYRREDGDVGLLEVKEK